MLDNYLFLFEIVHAYVVVFLSSVIVSLMRLKINLLECCVQYLINNKNNNKARFQRVSLFYFRLIYFTSILTT